MYPALKRWAKFIWSLRDHGFVHSNGIRALERWANLGCPYGTAVGRFASVTVVTVDGIDLWRTPTLALPFGRGRGRFFGGMISRD